MLRPANNLGVATGSSSKPKSGGSVIKSFDMDAEEQVVDFLVDDDEEDPKPSQPVAKR